LCSSAEDTEILIDSVAAYAIGTHVPLVQLDPRTLKGFDQPVPVFAAVIGVGQHVGAGHQALAAPDRIA
jgi:class 3 adenylate cyclase